MPHNLFGGQMAFVGELPWHQLGSEVPPNVSSEEMLRSAGLDWTVTKVPATGARVIKQKFGAPVYDRYFITREAREKEQVAPVLGIVSPGYELLQNREAFAFFDPFLSAGQASYEAAGALGNGERVWVQVRVGDPIEVAPGDVVDKFLLLANSHDGNGAISLRFTPVRVVCQNTLNLATKGRDHVVNIRHSKRVRDRLADQQVAFLLQLVGETFERAADQFSKLAKSQSNPQRREKFLTQLFPPTNDQKKKAEVPKWWKAVDAVLGDEKVTPPKSRDTMWGLYNAVTRAEDYRETRESLSEARLDRVWFGRGADLKIRALEHALELCDG
jgi:phage/plasmid-like protein (TIGR03299 family)